MSQPGRQTEARSSSSQFAMVTRNNVLMQVLDACPRGFADVEADIEAERVVNRLEAVH